VSPERCEYLSTDPPLRFTFTDMNPVSRGSGLEAWVVIRWQGNIPDPMVIARGTYNLKGARTVTTLTNEILAGDATIDQKILRRLVDQVIGDVISVFYDQHNTQTDHQSDTEETRWLLRPLLEQGSVTRLVAPGGTLKSLLALAVCVTVATGTPKLLGLKPVKVGPALFLDWEGDYPTFKERLKALCKSAELPLPDNIGYLQMTNPLYQAHRRVAASILDNDPIMLVVDSNAMARGSSGEGSAEDSTIRTIGVLRQMALATLIIDHKSDEKIRRQLTGGYGSIFNRNLARLEWEVVGQAKTDTSRSIAMRLEKANNIRTGKELAFRFQIDTDPQDRWIAAKVEPVDPGVVLALAAEADSKAEQIARWLSMQTEPQTVAAIAQAIGRTLVQVRSALNQARPGMFENVGIGKGMWRLAGAEPEREALPNPFE
jgi:RecA-family ATPase